MATPLGDTDLDNILKNLPSSTVYAKFDKQDSLTEYSSNCATFETQGDEVKNLCEKFLSNIKNLPNLNNDKEKHDTYSVYLSYWILDEIRKIFLKNHKNVNNDIVSKLADIGNVVYHNFTKKYLFYYYDFDLKKSKEEKDLLDYFQNYSSIIPCYGDKCKLYHKYVSYIKTLYNEHKKDCLWFPCDYFIHDTKYDPNYLLSKIQDHIDTPRVQDINVVLPERNEQPSYPNPPESDISMVVKYMNCAKVNDTSGEIIRYICEDSAYRQHTEKVVLGENVKQGDYRIYIKDAIKEIGDKKCKEIYDKSGKFLGLNCNSKDIHEDSELVYLTRTKDVVDSSQNTGQEIVSNKRAEGSIESEELPSGIVMLPSNREVPDIGLEPESTVEQANSNSFTPRDVSLFLEVPERSRRAYTEELPAVCPPSSGNGASTCENALEIPISLLNGEEKDSMGPSGRPRVTHTGRMNIFDISEDKDNTLNSYMMRAFITTALTLGIIGVSFVYYKFTPLGSWLRKKVLKKKEVNTCFDEESTESSSMYTLDFLQENRRSDRIHMAYHHM
ncbi:PIR Superfamily Protein [Plasmodium ovale curtisi]|uniref:PIR Superfamily Protein n=1 Tax=Plasmodium ovale curtisi TaxID=864141 RepID=A0A1A8WFS8_PLAOA|nr:PIR Superfamily Protein [Plasmodium ovale curtisi]